MNKGIIKNEDLVSFANTLHFVGYFYTICKTDAGKNSCAKTFQNLILHSNFYLGEITRAIQTKPSDIFEEEGLIYDGKATIDLFENCLNRQ